MELLRIHKNRSLDNRKCLLFKAPWLTNNFSIDTSKPTTADWMSGVGTVVETAPAASEGNTKLNSVGNSDGTASTTGTNSETSQTTTQTPKETPHRVQYYADSETISGSPKTPATISTSWGSGKLSGGNGNTPTGWNSTSNKDVVIKYMKANYGSDADLKIGDKALSDFNSVQEMLQALLKLGYSGLEDDNYAGLQTMETMRDYFGGSHRLAGDTAPTQDPSKGLTPQAVIPETKVPEETTINAAERDKLNTQNYTRSQVRQKMRSAGLGAYDYSGSQRKALRNYYAGNRDADTIKSIQSMGLSSEQLGALGLNALSERVGKNGEWYSSKAMRDAFENPIELKKQGGSLKMKVNYFQAGGTVATQAASSQQSGSQDIQTQVVQLVQAAMQGDQKATQAVQQIMDAAKKGDQQAAQIAQLIQEVVKQMQGQAQSAKRGAKLSYLHSLKTGCPDGYEVSYNKKGGHLCKECLKKQANGGELSEEDKKMGRGTPEQVKAVVAQLKKKYPQYTKEQLAGSAPIIKNGQKYFMNGDGELIEASKLAPKSACGSKLKKKLISGKKLAEGGNIPYYKDGHTLRADETKETGGRKTYYKGTDKEYTSDPHYIQARAAEEALWNDLSLKEALNQAAEMGRSFIGYKGKVYRTGSALNAATLRDAGDKERLTRIYGANLGWTDELQNLSDSARAKAAKYRQAVRNTTASLNDAVVVGDQTNRPGRGRTQERVAINPTLNPGKVGPDWVGLRSPNATTTDIKLATKSSQNRDWLDYIKKNAPEYFGKFFNTMVSNGYKYNPTSGKYINDSGDVVFLDDGHLYISNNRTGRRVANIQSLLRSGLG